MLGIPYLVENFIHTTIVAVLSIAVLATSDIAAVIANRAKDRLLTRVQLVLPNEDKMRGWQLEEVVGINIVSSPGYDDSIELDLANGEIIRTDDDDKLNNCLLYTSPSPRDLSTSRMPSSA